MMAAISLEQAHVHIVGLGLMGASLAKSLGGKVGQLSGSDIKPEVVQYACTDEVIHSAEGPEAADIVIVAVPPHYITQTIGGLKLKPGALLMDLGSTKAEICRFMDGLPPHIQAVGGHPMCGLAENGYRNAIGHLYQGARFILCPTQLTPPQARPLAEALVTAVGAIPIWMDAMEHDQLAGAISHLPHLMSFALMRLAMQLAQNDQRVWEMAAGGFDGATRLARTDEQMITGMFRTNADQIRHLAALLHQHLDELTALLDDSDQLRQELGSIVEARRNYTKHYGERMIS
jgi:prephenate dehydrogenase